jgi:thiosulfate/3-mercaptopyruvate sulfurtransferase
MLSFILLTLTLADAPTYARPAMLISAADLAKQTAGRDVVLIDPRPRKSYDAGHIPGAVWIDAEAWSKAIVANEGKDPWVERIGKAGIDGTLPVVVYDDSRPMAAARVWWILRYWGIKDVRLLNGGLKAWQNDGGKLDRTTPTIKEGKPDLKQDPTRLATRDRIHELLKSKKIDQLVDARSRGEHCGEKKTAKRNGAIPGAQHLEWSDTIDARTGKFKSADQLTKLFKEAGIDLDRPSTTYCQSGGRAAVMAFVIELMTGKPARNYYRSWAEWGNHPDTPIVTPKK